MKKMYLNVLVLTILVFGLTTSCEKDDFVVINDETETVEAPVLLKSTTYIETSFPTLGPSAASCQTAEDISNPVNIGTLDCRTMDNGGYSEQTLTLATGGTGRYGVYGVRGSTARYDGTKTRVERSFNTVKRAVNRSAKFTGVFRIANLSDARTSIVQVHDAGIIRSGLKVGERATSAIFLVYATKNSSNSSKFDITIHESVVPFTDVSSGSREQTFLMTVDVNKDYTVELTTGYNASKKAWSKVKITERYNSSISKSKTMYHTYTQDACAIRYGAYGASDTGDTWAQIKYRNVSVSRTN